MIIKLNRKKMLLAAGIVFFLAALLAAVQCVDFYNDKKTDGDHLDAVQASTQSFDAETAEKQDFFIEYRLERDRLRAEQAQILQEDLKASAADSERRELRDHLLVLFNEKKLENDMENMIRAKGFEDAIVICRSENANAIIKAERLERGEVMQIADVIKRLGNIKEENIVISAK